MDRSDHTPAAFDPALLNARLGELHTAQLRGVAPSAAPAWLRGPEDVAELALWGLLSTDCTCRAEAVVVAAWFRDRPELIEALGGLAGGPDDRLAMAAAVSAYDLDEVATERVESLIGEDVYCRDASGVAVARDMLGWIRGRWDPGAVAVAGRAAGLGNREESEVYAQLLAEVGALEDLAQKVRAGMGIMADAAAPMLALRCEPEAVTELVEAMHWDDCFTFDAMNGLADRADVAAIGPLLRHWEGWVTTDDVNFAGLCALVEALGRLPGGRPELHRLRADRDSAVATLARSFLVRMDPTPDGLAELRARLSEAEDPDAGRWHPAAALLDRDGSSPPEVSRTLEAKPRIHRWAPPWAGLPPRDPALPSLVPCAPGRPRGWCWLERPEVRPDRLPRHWENLPVLAEAEGFSVRWAGPLVDRGHAELFDCLTDGRTAMYGDMGELLARCRFPKAPFEVDGEVDPTWSRDLVRAAGNLAEGGGAAEVETWIAWLGFQLAGPHEVLKARYRAADFDEADPE